MVARAPHPNPPPQGGRGKEFTKPHFIDKERRMTHLTPEERVLGRENANRALGVSRRDLLKAAAATPALGAFYFSYGDMKGKSAVKAAIIGTGDEGCQAMIRSHNREYLDFIR